MSHPSLWGGLHATPWMFDTLGEHMRPLFYINNKALSYLISPKARVQGARVPLADEEMKTCSRSCFHLPPELIRACPTSLPEVFS